MNDPREEKVVPTRTFDVMATYTIQKKVSVLTDDYELYENDCGGFSAFTDNTDWEASYRQDHHTITELISKFAEMLKDELRHLPHDSLKAKELRLLLNDCYGWTVEGENYEEA